MRSAILEALAAEMGGTRAQLAMMESNRQTLVQQPVQQPEPEAKIQQAISLLTEVLDETRRD